MCLSSPSTTIINVCVLHHLYARAHLTRGLTLGDFWIKPWSPQANTSEVLYLFTHQHKNVSFVTIHHNHQRIFMWFAPIIRTSSSRPRFHDRRLLESRVHRDAVPPPSGNLPCRCRAEGSAFPPLVEYHQMLSIPCSYCRRFTGFEPPKVYRLRGLVRKIFVWARGNDI